MLISLIYRYEVPVPVAEKNLPGTSDFLLSILQKLVPLSQPAWRPPNGEEDRIHGNREAHSLINEARLEVHIGIQFALHEVLVLKRNLLQFHGQFELGIRARHFKYLVSDLTNDLGPRIVVLIHPVTESH